VTHFDDLPDLLTVKELQMFLRLGRNRTYELLKSRGNPKHPARPKVPGAAAGRAGVLGTLRRTRRDRNPRERTRLTWGT
jgi:hypothetical protein